MALTSAYMLRQYNKTIPVRVFLIDSDKQTKIDKYADSLNLEVVRFPSTKKADEQKYFCLNREYLSTCVEDSVLYIDGDTFIFGDVNDLFDKYEKYDFAAATDDWITGTEDWNQKNLLDSYKLVGGTAVPVFNGGLTLWNNRCVRGWASNYLPEMCTRLQNKEFPLTDWLFANNRSCYHKETFSICLYVSSAKLRYKAMDRKDVVNLFSKKDYDAWKVKDYIVYHCFNQNWKMFVKDLMPKKAKFFTKPRILRPNALYELNYGFIHVLPSS
jgi:lipopolysaccharide biosynthesis glycosyltransferase